MPIYEYECVNCGERFEVYHHSRDINKTEESQIKCPKCGAEGPQRVYSTFGTGFSCTTSNDTGYVSSG